MVTLAIPNSEAQKNIQLFSAKVKGISFDDKANHWVSNYLNGSFQMYYLSNNYTTILPKRGGLIEELKTYTDSSPIHLINLSTLAYLNSKLKTKIDIRNFRPNIVIKTTHLLKKIPGHK